MPTPRENTTERAKSSKAAETPEDAIKLLTKDHREVEALFKKFEEAKDDNAEKADIVAQICESLSVHAEIEEEIFYPAARDALSENGDDLLDEAEVEHGTIKSIVAELEDADPDDDLYDAKVKVLAEYVQHHVKEEEGEMFPEVKKTDLDLDQLGAEMFERKNELMADDDQGEEDNPE
jgi:hemerythrin superfamily protein